MTTAFVHHPDCVRHDMGAGHPERAARVTAIDDQLLVSGLLEQLAGHLAPIVDRTALERVHATAHIDAMEAAAPAFGLMQIDPDTAMNPYSLTAARRAAGAAVLATDLVIAGRASNAFCNVRPPGHHAERNQAMGFCFFNNVAVAAAHALDGHGLDRVAIVDFDVHHGNGTEDIFRDDPRVLMVSTFQHPFYPYSGTEGRSARMVNVPLAAGSGSAAFRAAVTAEWLPALDAFRPQMLFVSAGFDAHRDDDMGALRLVEDDYAWVTQLLVEVAGRHAGGRIVSLLEGGYELRSLGLSAAAHVKVLMGA